jgi:hypothetical protein
MEGESANHIIEIALLATNPATVRYLARILFSRDYLRACEVKIPRIVSRDAASLCCDFFSIAEFGMNQIDTCLVFFTISIIRHQLPS